VANSEAVYLEQFEFFVKQTLRSRCNIYGANGQLDLLVPLKRIKGTRQLMKDICISYDEDWQKLHWRSFESAYRRSPYFEYYEHSFRPLLEVKHNRLWDLNMTTNQWLLEKLDLEQEFQLTQSYEKEPEAADLRNAFKPNKARNESKALNVRYHQTFEDRSGFLPNLSALDLLFNLGPQANVYLHELAKPLA